MKIGADVNIVKSVTRDIKKANGRVTPFQIVVKTVGDCLVFKIFHTV